MMILSAGKPRKTYGLRLSEDEAARLDRVAAVFSVPRSAAVRILIDEAANALDVLEARGRSARSAGEGGAE